MATASASGATISSHKAQEPSYDVTLKGRYVTIVPAAPDYAESMFELLKGPDTSSLFTYLWDNPYTSASELSSVLEQKRKTTNPWTYVILKNSSDAAPQPVGMASLMRMDDKNRVIEVGSILYTNKLQRTAAATEAMYLLAKYVFETLGFRRYEWKCDSLNAPSRRAAARLGFTYEGTFRQHMIVKGQNRDTAWFSMLDGEWPAVKTAMEAWLDPQNFDAEGKQKRTLGEISS